MNDESTIRTVAEKGTGPSLLAAVGAALAASLCCLGPLLLVSLGASGAWIGSLGAFAPYRPVFMVMSAGFLGFAFFRVYRPGSAEACDSGSACARSGAKRVTKASLWLVTLLTLGLSGVPYVIARLETVAQRDASLAASTLAEAMPLAAPSAVEPEPLVVAANAAPLPAPVSAAAETAPATVETTTLSVEGMTCVSCTATVEKSLTRLDGVVAARVTFDPPRAVVEFDPTKLSPEDLANATGAVGYPSAVAD